MSPGSHMATVGGLIGSFIWGQGHSTLPQFPLVCSLMLPPKGLLGRLSLSLPTTVTSSTGSLSLNRLEVWEAVTLQGRLHPTPGGLRVAGIHKASANSAALKE